MSNAKLKTLSQNKRLRMFFSIVSLAMLGRFFMVCLAFYLNHFIGMGKSDLIEFLRDPFIRVDAEHYLYLAGNWYQTTGSQAYLIVFFPLYPVLIRIVSFITGDLIAAGYIVSYVCFGLACYFLFELARLDYDIEISKDSVLFLMLFPFGVFFAGLFTESVFVLLSILTLYMARKKKHFAACVFASLATLSRLPGTVLLVPIVYEYIISAKKDDERFPYNILKGIRPDFLYILLVPLALFLYFLLNKVLHNDWLAFLKFQADEPFYNSAKWIGDNLNQHLDMGLNHPALNLIIYFVQLFMFFASLGLLLYALKKGVRTSYLAYSAAYIAVVFTHGWLISGPRYVMGCVPLYIILATIQNKSVKNFLFFGFGMFLVFFTMLFMQGQAIM